MKPQKLTYLKKGKAFGSNEHQGLAETVNWLIRFCDNLRGDGVYINVNNQWGDDPVITFSPTVPIGGGSTYTPYPTPFDLKQVTTTTTDPNTNEETTTTQWMIVNNVWYMGREVRQLSDYAIDETASYTYWLKIETDQYGQFSTSSIVKNTYAVPLNGGAFSAPTNTDQYTHYPLWSVEVSNGTITPTFDWRQTWKTPFYST